MTRARRIPAGRLRTRIALWLAPWLREPLDAWMESGAYVEQDPLYSERDELARAWLRRER